MRRRHVLLALALLALAAAFTLPAGAQTPDRLTALERRVALLEARVATLEGTPTPTPTPTPTVAPAVLPWPTTGAVALYHMMWATSGSPPLASTPANVNVINLAFLQGQAGSGTVRLPGWASQTRDSFLADARALRSRGVRIVASVGGSGGVVDLTSAARVGEFVTAVRAQEIPLDGIDWDLEGTQITPANITGMVEATRALRAAKGPNFSITQAPTGSYVTQYIDLARRLKAIDPALPHMTAQQFYEAVVTPAAALSRVDQMIAAGIPASQIGIGMMVGTEDRFWTVDECIAAVTYIKARHPNLGGGYLWEAGRAGTADWANRVGPLLRR